MNRQKLITILATIAIIATLTVSLFYPFGSATATTYNTDNMTVEGVLATDSYVLYPFRDENLIFGFSKYGELINGVAKQGLEYDGMDVFANSYVLEKDWSQGWFIDIHYADLENSYKNAWAYALYSDISGSTGIGGDWKEGVVNGPLGTPYGGRKTNVWTITDPIKVLYDGPRRFVAVTNTTLYGAATKLADDALVSVTITFEFNKVKKNVVLFKDIKRLDKGKFGRTFQVEFSNRGEWDIGATSAPPSYAHFYDNLVTVYDNHYHDFYDGTNDVTGYDMCQMIDEDGTYVGYAAFWPQLFGKLVDGTTHITRSTILSSLCTKKYNETWLALGSPDDRQIDFPDLGWPSSDPYPVGLGDVDDEPMVYKNQYLLTGGGVDYTWVGGGTDTITFEIEPANTDRIIVVYKHSENPDGDDMILNAGHEPDTPYVIGEWCFDLENEDFKRQFRAVTQYGLTDRHDADDNDANAETWSNGANVIDSEVQYYLGETFNPYDLYNAVHKQESRWVDIRTLTSSTNHIHLIEGLDDTNYYNTAAGAWEPYYLSPETWANASAVVDSTWVNEFDDGATYTAHRKNWALHLTGVDSFEMLMITPKATTPTAAAPLTLQLGDLVDFDFWYKSLGNSPLGPYIEINVTDTANPALATKYATIQARSDNWISAANGETGWNHYTLNTIEGFIHTYTSDSAFQLADQSGTTLPTGEFHSFEYWTSKLPNYFVHYVGVMVTSESAALVDDVSIGYLERASGIRYERVYNMEEDKLIPTDWDEYCSFAERVLVDGVLIDRDPYYLLRNYVEGGYAPYYEIDFETGTITFYHWSLASGYHLWTLPIGTHVKVLYSTIEENEKGRYEWIVVGKNAATIDAAATGYITQAFDSIKDIHVLKTGMDLNETVYGPYAPFVMGGATTGTRTDYYYNYPSDNRTGLRDDWCTTIPISSSNMIFMAGPRANLGTEYFNDFINVFFAESEYVVNNTGQANKILALSCWDKNIYGNGYGVISVYKDLNGTIGLLFWGYQGQDFYYTCEWFWNYPAGILTPDGTVVYSGIEYLQHENHGVTDIILKITYPTADPTHPTITVTEERLGTISEKVPHDCPG